MERLCEAATAVLGKASQADPPPPFPGSEESQNRLLAEQTSFPAAPHAQQLLRRRAEKLLEEADAAASDVAAEAKEQEAARLFLAYQALTFQHLFLVQYAKRLGRIALKKATNRRAKNPAGCPVTEEETIEERLAEQQRRRMLFRGEDEAESLGSLVGELPPAWTILQLSCVDSCRYTRFKETKRGEASKRGNPALCLLRLRSVLVELYHTNKQLR
jgi:hypothetical protein